jgi:hypothetical protein
MEGWVMRLLFAGLSLVVLSGCGYLQADNRPNYTRPEFAQADVQKGFSTGFASLTDCRKAQLQRRAGSQDKRC